MSTLHKLIVELGIKLNNLESTRNELIDLLDKALSIYPDQQLLEEIDADTAANGGFSRPATPIRISDKGPTIAELGRWREALAVIKGKNK